VQSQLRTDLAPWISPAPSARGRSTKRQIVLGARSEAAPTPAPETSHPKGATGGASVESGNTNLVMPGLCSRDAMLRASIRARSPLPPHGAPHSHEAMKFKASGIAAEGPVVS
jgi:hypothetical protein